MGGQRPVTRIVGNPAPVAREFDWIPSPRSDGFRLLPAVAGARLAEPVLGALLAPTAWLVACRRSAFVQAVVPLASRRWESLPAG